MSIKKKKKKHSRKGRKSGRRSIFIMLFIFFATAIMVLYYYLNNSFSVKNKGEEYIANLVRAYPDFLKKIDGNELVWNDGFRMIVSKDSNNRPIDSLLNNPSISDQFLWSYDQNDTVEKMSTKKDPGRIRYIPFFLRMYGSSEDEVKQNLVPVPWLASLSKDTIFVTKINGVNKIVEAISQELEKIPALRKYLVNMGGTFKWRSIKGTERLSAHSFGIAIDINIDSSNYWQWDCKCTDEKRAIEYKNKIPMQLVKIFEKHKFIWGGRWYHYDTMHFEYRPEFFL